MTPRPIPDPVSSAPMLVAFTLSTIAAAVVAVAALARYAYDHLTKEQP